MKQIFIYGVFLFGVVNSLQSQNKNSNNISETYHIHKHELGINVTNVLANLFSLNADADPYPYLLTYRKHINSNVAFRSGYNLRINDFTDFEDGFDRQSNTFRTDIRLGFERKLPLSRKFLFSYGVDILGRYERERSTARDFFGSNFNNFKSKTDIFGGGFGPVMRFEFKISERMFLSVESSFYGFFSQQTQSLEINGFEDKEPAKSNFNLELSLPQSLFFNVAF